jgi:hypothetical protein
MTYLKITAFASIEVPVTVRKPLTSSQLRRLPRGLRDRLK